MNVFLIDLFQIYCHAIKAELVSIETQAEDAFLRGYLQNEGCNALVLHSLAVTHWSSATLNYNSHSGMSHKLD
jgi:hypothetical protein